MSLWKLRLCMVGTLAVIIGVSTTFFAVVLAYFRSLNIISIVLLVALFNIIQWLFAPHLINALYKVKEVKQADSPKLYAMVKQLSTKSGIKNPKLGIANIPIPNAFAYGSPLSGNRVAVTKGLLETLEAEEVEAVLGHELGHLKHRDVQIMMLVSFLPSLLYLIGRSTLFSAYYAGRRRGGGGALLIGAASMLVYFVLLLFTLGLSRLREYYADRHSASIIEDGPRKLSEGLAKIVSKTWKIRTLRRKKTLTSNSFKTLFISDPDRAESDAVQIAEHALSTSDQALVQTLIKKRITSSDRVMELFSTHPNITKRLEALQALAKVEY